jgi:hypothetical protein
MCTDGVVAVGGLEHLVHALGSERGAGDPRDGLASGNVGLLRVEATKARLRLRCPNSSKASAMAGIVPIGSPGSGGEGRRRRRCRWSADRDLEWGRATVLGLTRRGVGRVRAHGQRRRGVRWTRPYAWKGGRRLGEGMAMR